jgi:hypothetical protein
MIKKEIAPGIHVYSDVIDGYESLVNDIEDGVRSAKISWLTAGIVGGENKKIRDTDSFSLEYIDHVVEEEPFGYLDAFNKNLSNIFYEGFTKYENDYKQFYGITFSDHQNYEVLRYGNGQMFKNHVDDCQDWPRRISTVYYLNDNYEGGAISFPRFNVTYQPKANDFLIFPSTYVYNHSISEVTKGTRYAVVSWIK